VILDFVISFPGIQFWHGSGKKASEAGEEDKLESPNEEELDLQRQELSKMADS